MHRSRRCRVAERAIVLVGGSLRRCHACNSRYVKFGGSFVRLTDLRRIWERCLLALAMTVAAVLIMAAIIWLSRSQVASANETGRLAPAGRPAAVSDRQSV